MKSKIIIIVLLFLLTIFYNFIPAKSQTQEIGLIRENCTGYTNCFTSLAAWEAGYGGINFGACAPGDLVCADKIAVAQIDGTWINPDTSTPIVNGWVTDATHYIKIYTTPTARHDGKYNTNKYRLESTETILSVQNNHVRIDGLQFKITSTANYNRAIILSNLPGTTGEIYLSNNIIKGEFIGSANNEFAIDITYQANGNRSLYMYNNVIYDFINGTSNNINGIYLSGGWTAYVYNNTIQNTYLGFVQDQGTFISKNNIAQDCVASCFSGTFHSSSDYNISSMPDAPGSHSKNSATVNFLDQVNDNFHLNPGDTVARDAGANLSLDANLSFSTDIDSEARTGVWDIGADETGGSVPSCTESWMCSAWNACSGGTQTRTCSDANTCGTTTNRPALTQSCAVADTQAPSVPTNLTATVISSAQINLSWTASTDNVGVAGYRIYRNGTQAGMSVAVNYSDTGLTSATSYTYAVAAYDAAGNVSSQTAQISATTQTAPTGGVITASLISSRTSCVAPCAVFFEGTQSKDSDGRSIEVEGLIYQNLSRFAWDFGVGSEGDVGGRYFEGFNAAHVYENSGTYTVTLNVTDVVGRTASTSRQIQVNAFSGTTYYVRADGNDANAGTVDSPSGAWATYGRAMQALNGNSVVASGSRILFRKGDVFTTNAYYRIRNAHDVIVGAYGSGNRPIVQYNGGALGVYVDGMIGFEQNNHNITFMDLSYDGSGAVPLIERYSGVGAIADTNILLLRVAFTRSNSNIITSESSLNPPTPFDGFFLVSSDLTFAGLTSIYGYFNRLVILNSVIEHAPNNHNLYLAHIGKGVLAGNRIGHPRAGPPVNTWNLARHCLRISGTYANTNGITQDVVVSNNTFDGSGTYGGITVSCIHFGSNDPISGSGGVQQVMRNVLFENNYIKNSRRPIDINDGYNNLTVRNNIIENIAPWAAGQDEQAHVEIRRFFDHDSARGVRIYGNIIINKNYVGPAIAVTDTGANDIEIKNNIVYLERTTSEQGWWPAGIQFASSSLIGTVRSSNNLFYHSSFSPNWNNAVRVGTAAYTLSAFRAAYPTMEVGGVEGNPLFASYAGQNYHLQSGSRAIDAGASLPSVYRDYDGVLRPQGVTLDIGAFEYASGIITPPACVPAWSCTAWSTCSQAGNQTRTCTDTNNCAVNTNKPAESQSCTPPDITSPNQITQASVSEIGQSSARLAWPSTSDNIGVIGYDLRWSTSPITQDNFSQAMRAQSTLLSPTPGSTQEYYISTGLTPGTTYYFAVVAFDASGNASLISNVLTITTLGAPSSTSNTPSSQPGTISVISSGGGGGQYTIYQLIDTTPPREPEKPAASPADGQVIFNWTNPSDSDFVRIIIKRSETDFPKTKDDGMIVYEGDKEIFTDTGLENDKIYYYSIFAYDRASNYSSPIQFQITPKKAIAQIDMPIIVDENIDSDHDGLIDTEEDSYGTDKNNPDTDGDSFSDKEEINSGNDPINPGGVINKKLTEKLKGKILLQVQRKGEAWYVNPSDGKRYYLRNGNFAYQIMRKLSLGITDKDLAKIPIAKDSPSPILSPNGRGESLNNLPRPFGERAGGEGDTRLVNRLKGKILLQVQAHGEAWYVNPADGKRYYMKDGATAYEMMRKFGLGAKTSDIIQVPYNRVK